MVKKQKNLNIKWFFSIIFTIFLQLADILKYHKKADNKLNGLDYFSTGIHPEFQMTRCFFVVKKDGS